RAAANNIVKLDNYLSFLKETPAEVEILTQHFLISVTALFRDQEAYNIMETVIIPDMLAKLSPGEELRLWVAGCATGEEAYSLAMMIHEQLTGKHENTEVKIFATDIDSMALLHAGKGVYSIASVKTVSAKRLKKFFVKEVYQYRVISAIRKMIIFAKHDLVKNPPYCNMHFISCRNLLIYMAPLLQKKVYTMLLFGLKLDGYLFLGSSENPTPIIKNLEVIHATWKIYKNLEIKRAINFDGFSLPQMADVKDLNDIFTRKPSAKLTSQTLEEAINITLVNEMTSLVICIDTNNQVLKTYGDTTNFLLQKNFNTNLSELLPRPLAVAFNTLCINTKKTNQTNKINGIKIKQGAEDIIASITVSPLNLKKGDHGLLLVIFKAEQYDANMQPEVEYDEKLYFNQYTILLEEELKDLQEKLQSTYEQLDASNDNMQSYNEELLSSNEEMQSTNEEMQSVNEELHTINADFQLKNKELQEVNDDLNNYFRSNINGQLFVNNDLLLMRFSPGTVKQINLLPTDIGRPLSNISTNIKFETIEKDIKKVIAEGGIITKEVETDNGKWYQVMTMPYVHTNNKSNGAILTFNDITELKQIQSELDKKNESLLRINADLDNFVLTATHDLLAPLGNIEMSIGVMNELEAVDPRLEKFTQIIGSSVKKFRTLITEIGHVAKLENDLASPEVLIVDDVLNDIEWSLNDKIEESGATINRNLEVKEIFFSKKNFRSIVYNLVSNSIKYRSEAAPVVNVHAFAEKDYIKICVEDNGIGIPEKDLQTIFKLYGRLNNAVEGNGIGLSLAKKIVDAAGGNIIVESKPGVGSKFTVCLKLS
ncbi:MAG: PAS domain-containing protein, partial [Gloeobacteraceae cyanobacterium ES-bin-316]|nr:PAS domain-containing protein [Ferruginibacter sp.]